MSCALTNSVCDGGAHGIVAAPPVRVIILFALAGLHSRAIACIRELGPATIFPTVSRTLICLGAALQGVQGKTRGNDDDDDDDGSGGGGGGEIPSQ
jgi:hypothetical protein